MLNNHAIILQIIYIICDHIIIIKMMVYPCALIYILNNIRNILHIRYITVSVYWYILAKWQKL